MIFKNFVFCHIFYKNVFFESHMTLNTWATRQTRREGVRSTLLTKRKWKNNTACNSNVCKLLFNSSLSDFEKSRYAVQTFTISKKWNIYIITKQLKSINVAMMPKSNSRNCSWTNYVKIHVYQKFVFGHNFHKTKLFFDIHVTLNIIKYTCSWIRLRI